MTLQLSKDQERSNALSRCKNPKDCECLNQDTSEPLKCDACKNMHQNIVQEMMHSEFYE